MRDPGRRHLRVPALAGAGAVHGATTPVQTGARWEVPVDVTGVPTEWSVTVPAGDAGDALALARVRADALFPGAVVALGVPRRCLGVDALRELIASARPPGAR